jgi:UDP-N-acetylmuramate--alanine ligase
MTRIHLMGIGGSGVSALATVFMARGETVSGCDANASDAFQRLAALGAALRIGHDPSHLEGQDVLVYSGAVKAGEPELEAARTRGMVTLSRAEALARLIADSEAVAVAGTHGKTTITFMLGRILGLAGADPTVLVGDGANVRAGQGRLLVAEADESDGSLILHRPRHAIVTGIELDHPDHFPDLDSVTEVFAQFLSSLPPDGVAVLCADDPKLAGLATSARRVTYGFLGAEYACTGDRPFKLLKHGQVMGVIPLQVPGRHNVQNACGAAAMALELGIPFATVAAALAGFTGAHRRLERLGRWRGAELYDDYGHHPTEVRATLQAARELPHRRLVIVFQPHRFSRLQALLDDFARSFAGADEVIVTEVYGAGEDNPGGLSAGQLAELVPGARFAPHFSDARAELESFVESGDLLLFMGAGDIWRLGRELANAG